MAINTQKLLPSSRKTGGLIAKSKGMDISKFVSNSSISSSSNSPQIDDEDISIVKVKLIEIHKLLKGTLAADKKKLDDEKGESAQEKRDDKEKEVEDVKEDKKAKKLKLPKVPGFGLWDFLKNVFFGWALTRLLPFVGILKPIIGTLTTVGEWVIDIGGKIADGLLTIVDKAIDAKKDVTAYVDDKFGEDAEAKFKEFTKALELVLNTALIAAMVGGGGPGGVPRGRPQPRRGIGNQFKHITRRLSRIGSRFRNPELFRRANNIAKIKRAREWADKIAKWQRFIRRSRPTAILRGVLVAVEKSKRGIQSTLQAALKSPAAQAAHQFSDDALANLGKAKDFIAKKSTSVVDDVSKRGTSIFKSLTNIKWGDISKNLYNFGKQQFDNIWNLPKNILKNLDSFASKNLPFLDDYVKGAWSNGKKIADSIGNVFEIAKDPKKLVDLVKNQLKPKIVGLVEDNKHLKKLKNLKNLKPENLAKSIKSLLNNLGKSKGIKAFKGFLGAAKKAKIGGVDAVAAGILTLLDYGIMGESAVNALVKGLSGLVGYATGFAVGAPFGGAPGFITGMAGAFLGEWAGDRILEGLTTAFPRLTTGRDMLQNDGRPWLRNPAIGIDQSNVDLDAISEKQEEFDKEAEKLSGGTKKPMGRSAAKRRKEEELTPVVEHAEGGDVRNPLKPIKPIKAKNIKRPIVRKKRRRGKLPNETRFNPGKDLSGDAKMSMMNIFKGSFQDKIGQVFNWIGGDEGPSSQTINKHEKSLEVGKNLSKVDFFGPILAVTSKVLLGEKPSNDDYSNVGRGINLLINSGINQGKLLGGLGAKFAQGGLVDSGIVDILTGGGDIAKWTSKMFKEVSLATISKQISKLTMDLSLGKDSIKDKEGGGSGGGAGGGSGGAGGAISTGGISSGNGVAKGVSVAKKLIADLGISSAQAAGIVGNFLYESAGMNPGEREGSPFGTPEKPPALGTIGVGYGWAQWTNSVPGDRLDKFLKSYGGDKGKIATDDDNYRYLMTELKGSESLKRKGVITGTYFPEDDPLAASDWFRENWERAGVPADKKRRIETQQVFDKIKNLSQEQAKIDVKKSIEAAGQFISPDLSGIDQGSGSEAAQRLKKDFPQITPGSDKQVYASGLGFYLKKIGAGLGPLMGDFGDPKGAPVGGMENRDHGGVVGSHRGTGHHNGIALDLGANSARMDNYQQDQKTLWPSIAGFLKKYGLNEEPFLPQVLHGRGESFSPTGPKSGPDPHGGHDNHFHVEFHRGGKVGGMGEMYSKLLAGEFVLDIDSTKALEDNRPGFLDALNKADYDGALEVLKNYASYDDPSQGSTVYLMTKEVEKAVPVPMETVSSFSSSGSGSDYTISDWFGGK